MFSSAELAYLRIVSEGGPADWPERIEARFPNPAYRRKIRWGIRQKAIRSYDGWRLYLTAAERDPGLSLERSGSGLQVPVYEDLLVAGLRRLGGRPAPPRAPRPAPPARPEDRP